MHEDEMARLHNQLIPIIEQIDTMAPNSPDLEVAALKQLMGASDAAAIRAESPRDFFIRFMTWVILRNPEMNKVIHATTMKALGHVADEDLAHVVAKVESSVAGSPVTQMKVMTLKRQDGEWRMTLTGDIEGITKVMEMRVRRGRS